MREKTGAKLAEQGRSAALRSDVIYKGRPHLAIFAGERDNEDAASAVSAVPRRSGRLVRPTVAVVRAQFGLHHGVRMRLKHGGLPHVSTTWWNIPKRVDPLGNFT